MPDQHDVLVRVDSICKLPDIIEGIQAVDCFDTLCRVQCSLQDLSRLQRPLFSTVPNHSRPNAVACRNTGNTPQIGNPLFRQSLFRILVPGKAPAMLNQVKCHVDFSAQFSDRAGSQDIKQKPDTDYCIGAEFNSDKQYYNNARIPSKSFLAIAWKELPGQSAVNG